MRDLRDLFRETRGQLESLIRVAAFALALLLVLLFFELVRFIAGLFG